MSELNIEHNAVSDLVVQLIDPNGVSLDLASRVQYGDATYGVVIPHGTNLQHDGTWTLEIFDIDYYRSSGRLHGWSLIVNPADPLYVAGTMVSIAGTESLALSEPTSVANVPTDSGNSTPTQLEQETADALFVDSGAEPIVSADPSTGLEETDEAAFDAAVGEFESDPLDIELGNILV
jgi:hypothetical protein